MVNLHVSGPGQGTIYLKFINLFISTINRMKEFCHVWSPSIFSISIVTVLGHEDMDNNWLMLF